MTITQMMGSRNPRIEIRTSLDGIIMTPEQIAEADRKVKPTTVPPASPTLPPQNGGNNIGVQPQNIPIVDYDLSKVNSKHFAVLPARTYDNYSYPETAVCLYRLGKNSKVEQVGKSFNFTVENTAKELTNDNQYIGNINWEQGMKIVLGLNGAPLTTRQGLDFLALLNSAQAKDLEGNLLGEKECKRVIREILGKENPWRSEWLDANFKYLDSKGKPITENGTFYLDRSHKLQNGILVPSREIMLPYLEESKWLELNSLLADSNSQGIPNPSVKAGQDIYFYKPSKDNNSVARFGADSGRAGLDCLRDATNADSSLGVRFASPIGRATQGNLGGKK